MKNIRNCKIRVLNVEHSKAIQEKAFGLGFKWDTLHSLTLQALKSECLYFGSCYITWSEPEYFSASDRQEIFFYNGEFHHEPEPKETNADIKTHPIFDNEFQYGEVVYISEDNGLLFGKGKYLSPLIERNGMSIIKFDDGGIVATVRDIDLEKQSDYEDRKNLENLSAKIANLFAASVETVYPSSKLMNPDSAIFLEFTKRLKSEDLLPF